MSTYRIDLADITTQQAHEIIRAIDRHMTALLDVRRDLGDHGLGDMADQIGEAIEEGRRAFRAATNVLADSDGDTGIDEDEARLLGLST